MISTAYISDPWSLFFGWEIPKIFPSEGSVRILLKKPRQNSAMFLPLPFVYRGRGTLLDNPAVPTGISLTWLHTACSRIFEPRVEHDRTVWHGPGPDQAVCCKESIIKFEVMWGKLPDLLNRLRNSFANKIFRYLWMTYYIVTRIYRAMK